MTELGDYKRLVERPMLDDLHATIASQRREIERLRDPFRACDAEDWQYLVSLIPDGGRGRFWKAVLAEMRQALVDR